MAYTPELDWTDWDGTGKPPASVRRVKSADILRWERGIASVDALLARVGAVEVPYPDGFAPLSALPNMRIFRVGTRYVTDLDIQALRPPAGATYWVSTGGTTGAAGTKEAPTTLASALAKPDRGTIMLNAGEYSRYFPTGVISKSVNLIATGPGVRLTGWETPNTLTWAVHAGNVYKTTRSNAQVVVDTRLEHRRSGDFAVYKQMANAAAVVAPGQWAIEGTTVYVWALGDANLVTDSSFLRVSINVAGTGIQVNNNAVVYLEGIDVEGAGNTATTGFGGYSYGSTDGLPTILMKDCTVKYSPFNGFGHTGARLVVSENCYASSNARDGFNYHSGSFNGQTVYPEFVEINCRSRYNGVTETTGETDNGTTAHAAGTRGIRIGGEHLDAFGPVIADVLGAQTWNIGMKAPRSRAGTRRWGYNTADAGSRQWLTDCESDSNDVALYAASSSRISVRGGRYENNRELFRADTGATIDRF